MTEGRLQDGPIVALATPLGTSALAVIRLSGTGCIALLAGVFSAPRRLAAAGGQTMVYGKIIRDKEVLDEVMLAVYRAPRSYTGEEMVEIFCHGSVPGIQSLLDCLLATGFRLALPGEFTLRAFLGGKMDLSRAEAVHEIVSSRTRVAQSHALKRLGGAVEAAVNLQKDRLVGLMAQVSVQLDYPEDELEEVFLDLDEVRNIRQKILDLAETYSSGRLYQAGVRVALAGKTNAGKSSLFNALVREERAIVSEIHGTTRDYLEAPFELKGIPVRLFDTAGLREATEAIEQEGIRRSGMVIESASLVLYLVDGTSGLEPGEEDTLKDCLARGIGVLVLWTKADSPQWKAPPVLEFGLEPVRDESGADRAGGIPVNPVIRPLPVSSLTSEGLKEVLAAMEAHIRPGASADEAEVLIDSPRQYQLLVRASEALSHVIEGIEAALSLDLVGLDVQAALQALGEITGEVRSEDILDRVFSGFCVGK